jgi:acyl dehydratase
MTRINKDTSIGQEFSGRPKRMSWERLWTFSGGPFTAQGWPKKNLHTDTEFARNLGLPTVGVSATQYLGHLTELMIDLFGERWLRHGKMRDVKFIKLVADGDVLTSKVKVLSKEKEGSGMTYHLSICIENQNEENVLIGSATGAVPVV